jgi:mono/diheme cytochrome c family protein
MTLLTTRMIDRNKNRFIRQVDSFGVVVKNEEMVARIKLLQMSVVLILVATLLAIVPLREDPRASVQELLLTDGVYTEQQASRGARVYQTTCESCHMPDLEGSEEGPTLLGEEFLEGWDGEILAELMILTVDTMPEEDPGGLSEQEYIDVLSYLFRENGYPPGDELTADALEEIVIDFEG